ncbi:MAG: hypothetical protein ACOCV8_03335, partial [Spirochaetota bacterium]
MQKYGSIKVVVYTSGIITMVQFDILENNLSPALIIDRDYNFYKANKSYYKIFNNKAILTKILKQSDIIYYSEKLSLSNDIYSIDCGIFEWIDKRNSEKYFFDIELTKIKINDNDNNNDYNDDNDDNFTHYLILFKNITDQYLMTQKTMRRSEELSILLEISLTESNLKDHKEIVSMVGEKITQLTKFNYAMFLFYKAKDTIGEILNFNVPSDTLEEYKNKIYSNQFPEKYIDISYPIILRKKSLNELDFFRTQTSFSPQEIIVLPAGIYGLFIFFSDTSFTLRISQEESFFTLLGQEIGRSLHRANLYH